MTLEIAILTLIILTVISLALWLNIKQFKPYPIANSTVLITGAGNGLGRQLSLKCAAENCHLICVDISAKCMDETIVLVRQVNPNVKVLGVECDLRSCEEVKRMRDKVYEHFDCVDIVVNNAGVICRGAIDAHTDEQIRAVMEINVLGVFWVTRAFLPKMKERNKGKIVSISSYAGKSGYGFMSPYCSSKFAVAGLMEALRDELIVENSNVKTLTVCPYYMNTRMLDAKRNLEARDVSKCTKSIVNAMKTHKEMVFIPGFLVYLFQLKSFLPDLLLRVLYKNSFSRTHVLDTTCLAVKETKND